VCVCVCVPYSLGMFNIYRDKQVSYASHIPNGSIMMNNSDGLGSVEAHDIHIEIIILLKH